MMLATPEDMRAAFDNKEIADLTGPRIDGYNEAEENDLAVLENAVLSGAILRASSRAASYLVSRYPVFGRVALPDGVEIPRALVNAVCDIARYFLTGTTVRENDPIVERFNDAIAWLKEIAAGDADLPGFDAVGGDDGEDDEELVSGDVVFLSNTRQWNSFE